MSMSENLRDKIEEIIAKVAENQSIEIYESSVSIRGKDSRITLKIDNGAVVSFEDCEKFSRELTQEIDESELLPNYSLEVSSPGLKRKIRNRDEFQRFLNSQVKVVYQEDESTRTVKGLLQSLIDETIIVESEKKKYEISIAHIVKANLDY